MSFEERIRLLEERLAQLAAENETLRKENETLRKEVDEWRRGLRERKKRRSSQPEKKRVSGKNPGRKEGHAGAQRVEPERIDDTIEYLPPTVCECGGKVVLTGDSQSTIVQDIPSVEVQNIRHTALLGECQVCKKKHRVKLPGQPNQGISIATVTLGPNLLALTLDLRFKRHVPLRGISGFMHTWFGVQVTASGLFQMTQRWKARTQSSYNEIVTFTRASDLVGADETPLNQSGLKGWAWLVRTEDSSLYRIELSRAGWVLDAMLGTAYKGTVCSDFYAVYTARSGFIHAYCGTHVMRKAKSIAEVSPSPLTERFRDNLLSIYARGKAAQKSGDATERRGVKISLGKLIANEVFGQHDEVAKLQTRLRTRFAGVVEFIDRPEVPADNNAAERDIRNLASYRNVSGGTRSREGSRVLAHWKSVTQTLHKNAKELKTWMVEAYNSFWRGLPPPTVFAET